MASAEIARQPAPPERCAAAAQASRAPTPAANRCCAKGLAIRPPLPAPRDLLPVAIRAVPAVGGRAAIGLGITDAENAPDLCSAARR